MKKIVAFIILFVIISGSMLSGCAKKDTTVLVSTPVNAKYFDRFNSETETEWDTDDVWLVEPLPYNGSGRKAQVEFFTIDEHSKFTTQTCMTGLTEKPVDGWSVETEWGYVNFQAQREHYLIDYSTKKFYPLKEWYYFCQEKDGVALLRDSYDENLMVYNTKTLSQRSFSTRGFVEYRVKGELITYIPNNHREMVFNWVNGTISDSKPSGRKIWTYWWEEFSAESVEGKYWKLELNRLTYLDGSRIVIPEGNWMFLSETSEKLLLINMKKKELFVATRDSLKKVKTSKIQNFALFRNTFIWIDSQGNVFEIPWNKEIESKKIASNVSNLYWLGSDGVILLLYDHDQRNTSLTSLTTDGIYFSEEVYH